MNQFLDEPFMSEEEIFNARNESSGCDVCSIVDCKGQTHAY